VKALQFQQVSALTELRYLLPRGPVGRLINSFIFGYHPDAEHWQRVFRQALYDGKTMVCPLVLTRDTGWDADNGTIGFVEPGWLHSRTYVFITRCVACDNVLELYVIHLDSAVLTMNLQMNNVTSWFNANAGDGDIPQGFTLSVGQCFCFGHL
jgi:hypothetical protein